MKLLSKRLFISDLPPNLTEDDIQEKFSKFGSVTSIEIKERKNVTLKNKYPTYAYITIDTDHSQLQQCFYEFTKNKWKGNLVEVQIAKENFLERLKKERESDKLSSLNKTTIVENIKVTNIPVRNGITRKKHFSSSDSSSDDSSSESEAISPKKIKLSKEITSDINSELSDKQTVNTFENKIVNKVTVSNVQENKLNNNNAGGNTKINISEQKRLQSITEMKRSYQKQKNVIKLALGNVDTRSNKKIVFDDEEYDNEIIESKLANVNDKVNNRNENRRALFDDGDIDDVEYNFEVKEQFQGKKGKKLMELQTKFKNDNRFKMDERFLEDEEGEISDDEDNTGCTSKETDLTKENDDAVEITSEEKQKQLAILENILGKTISKVKDTQTTSKKKIKLGGMHRYDPSQPEHTKYILNDNEPPKEKKKKQKKKKDEKEDEGTTTDIQTEEMTTPAVSKQTFYQVQENLKETLEQNETKSFSLLNMFGSYKEPADENDNDEPRYDKDTGEKTIHKSGGSNPFKYDSSEESDNDEQVKTNDEHQKATEGASENQQNSQNVSLGPTRLWTEPFFFKDDDYRLQEGMDFVQRYELDDKSEFSQIRRNIKEIVRTKVRHNLRKNKPFRKKLGGRKMIKIKKALKKR